MAFAGFLIMIPPLIWLFYRHSVMRIPGGTCKHHRHGAILTSSIHLLRLLRVVIGHLGYFF
jgi:hypothetical protein